MGVSGTVYSSGVRGVLADPFGSTLAFVVAGLFFCRKVSKITAFNGGGHPWKALWQGD